MTDLNAITTELQSPAQMLQQLQAAPDQLRRALGDRSSAELRSPASDGGMSVTEILCHIQDWEEITGDRVAQMLRKQTPELERFDDSLWSIEHDYAHRNAWEVVEAFTTVRGALVEALEPLAEDDWMRDAYLPGHETITITWLMDRVIRHDAKHLNQIVEALL